MNDNPRPAKEEDDPIVAEVRAHRRQLVEEHGGIEGLAKFLREQDAKRHQREQDASNRRDSEIGKSA
jgi:hypothetical protein